MRRCIIFFGSALQHVPERVVVAKDYQEIERQRKEAGEKQKKSKELDGVPLRYQILECRPGLPLALTKLKYLLACRRTHPEAGGDAEAFLRVSLAYQDVMKDYGVETVDNKIVNLGNFQVDDHEAHNYLASRAQIQSYIPISTLEDHIRQIEEVRGRLGGQLVERLAANDDEAMWLLEDIEDIMESTGLKTIRVHMLEDGSVTVAKQQCLTDGLEQPIFLTSRAEAVDEISNTSCDSMARGTADSSPDHDSTCSSSSHRPIGGSEPDAPGSMKIRHEADVSAADIAVLNAKNTLQDRSDVAGLASRTATEVMRNTEEVRQMRIESATLYVLATAVLVVVYIYIEGLARAKRQQKSRPTTMEHVQSDTMLPWWGNDSEYEAQVKRIFVEEWRRARATSRRAQTFQDGVARESLSEEAKKDMDLQIFTVTTERLRSLRENAEKHPGRQ